MDKETAYTIFAFGLICVMISVLVGSIAYNMLYVRPRRVTEFRNELEKNGISVQSGSIKDPLIAIEVSKAEFMQRAEQTKQVYFSTYNYAFYIFNDEEMTIAYFYRADQ